MNDQSVQDHIERLVAEEHQLLKADEDQGGADPERHRRLQEVTEELDRCWQALRQRRAREEYGLDPDNPSGEGD